MKASTTMQLSRGNAVVNTGLKAAMGALHVLDDAGCTVTGIRVTGATPIIIIDKPWPFARGGMRLIRPLGLSREIIYAARVHGVQVEWSECVPAPRRAVEGA